MREKGKSSKEIESETEWMEQGRSVPPYNFYGSPSYKYVFQRPGFNPDTEKPRNQIYKVLTSVALIFVCLACWLYLVNSTHQISNYWSLIMGVITGVVFLAKSPAEKFNATAGYLVFVGSGLGFISVSLILLLVNLQVAFEELRNNLGLFDLVQVSLFKLNIFDTIIFLSSIILALVIANFKYLKHYIRPKP